jgi:transposase
MLYVGIDVAKNKHDFCIIDSDGVIHINHQTISNSLDGFKFLVSSIRSALSESDRSNVKIGLESTGHYSINITNYLQHSGFEIITLNPLSTSLFRKAHTLRKTKTDKTDAMVIATMLITDDSKSYSPISYQIQELKSLTRHRYRLIGYRSKLKLSMTRLIDIVFPELPSCVWSIHQASVLALLAEYPHPEALSKAHLTKLTNLLIKASKGKYSKPKALELKSLASDSIGLSNDALAFELRQNIRLIQNVQDEIKLLDQRIKEILQSLDTPILSIPGISFTLASIIISEIGDITRFSSPAKLLAYAGMEPSTYQSGNFHASSTPMVKRGSTYLRWAIMQAARLVAMKDPTFSSYMKKKKSEGKHYYVALSHTGKKLIRVIFYFLKNNQQFAPQA